MQITHRAGPEAKNEVKSQAAQAEGRRPWWRLRFAAEVEGAFQESYYGRARAAVRLGLFLLVSISLISAGLASSGSLKVTNAEALALVGASLLNLALAATAFRRGFSRLWQPIVVASTLVAMAPPLLIGAEAAPATAITTFYALLILSRVQRLQFRWLLIELAAVSAIESLSAPAKRLAHWLGVAVTASAPGRGDLDQGLAHAAAVLAMTAILMLGPIVLTWRSEKFERSEFLAKYLLAQERNEERHKREETERMLHVLSQAIGGIVHDLGNPLTTVQMGAQTLDVFLDDDGEPDKEALREFTGMITDGARMLNYLRLSLMEQTRVLEGKPVPLELACVPVRQLVQAGAHYQKPRFASGRSISLSGGEMEVHVDEMRFVTIFMNLIGNALKYSDGEVRVIWRAHGEHALIAVLDQGRGGSGLSRAQAEKLFCAFGRLDVHAQIEGTGLGLLSVRKIAEAHGGEVYIEGHDDGTAASAPFSSAQAAHPAMLEAGFCTAFVAACPLKSPAPSAPPAPPEKSAEDVPQKTLAAA